MPYPRTHKPLVRERILRNARALFNRHGYDGVSIDGLMKVAGLTRGAFYAHFESKQALYLESIGLILKDHPAKRWPGVEFDLSAKQAAYSIVNAYLSDFHCKDIARSCPLVTQAETSARGSPAIKTAYENVLNVMVSGIEKSLKGTPKSIRRKAIAIAALCVGGLTLARATDSEEKSQHILDASRAIALHLLQAAHR